ncbi:MAG: response regulator [Bryobacteraceae bacterium]
MTASAPPSSLIVVEDEEPISMVLEEMLTGKGYEVRVVHNPADAMAAVRERTPDLMLMDINLSSDIDGIETIRRIHAEIAEVPHCFITAYSEDEIVARAEETGPMAYLMKPFECGDVVAMVSIALANARRLQERLRRAARLELAVKVAPEAMLFTDFAGKVQSINESAAALIEVPDGKARGASLASLVKLVADGGEDRTHEEIDQALTAAASGRFQTYWRMQKAGAVVPLMVNVTADLGIKEFVFRFKQVPAAALRAVGRENAPPPPPRPQAPPPPSAAAPTRATGSVLATGASESEDRVTGLPNRRAIEPRLAEPNDDPEMFVAALGVDHLAVLKQRFGAGAVDQVLLAFSQHLAQHLPDTCLIARWSASVFLIMPKEPGTVGLQREISRLLSTPMLHHLQLTGRSALLRVTASSAFFRIDESAVENLDGFVDQQTAK